MKHNQRTLMVLLAGIILTTSFSAQASSIEESAITKDHVIEVSRMQYIASASAALSIDTSGKATISGKITGYAGITDRVEATLRLQQYKNGNWITIRNFQKSKNSYRLSMSGNVFVARGFKYRVKFSIRAHNGNTSESYTAISSEKRY